MAATAANKVNAGFPYPPLDDARASIRLLQVHGRPCGRLTCTLSTISLDDAPVYPALSYRCGTSSATREILVNGSVYRIYPNLHRFLEKVVCSKLLSVPLFVDAVCINQAKIPERNSQVALMRDIYLRARQVAVWLGDDPPFMVRQFMHGTEPGPSSDGNDAVRRGVPDWSLTPTADGPFNLGTRTWFIRKAAWGATHQEYWERVWIMQELLLAQEAVFFASAATHFVHLISAKPVQPIHPETLSTSGHSRKTGLPISAGSRT
jgi:hypothetical protein